MRDGTADDNAAADQQQEEEAYYEWNIDDSVITGIARLPDLQAEAERDQGTRSSRGTALPTAGAGAGAGFPTRKWL